ncbi:ZIP family metal transporter [Candidatus Woesearchaeota archaeon]|nr:ZIP family metal transporter [Candidatus Woesearchaeota archaeon]
MALNFLYALLSIIIVSLVSLVGIFTLILKRDLLERIVYILVALAAGALVGGAFMHLLPEAVEEGGPVFSMALLGIILFFIIEIYLYWYHCHGGHLHKHKHRGKCEVRPMGYLNLLGDGVHNFIDGMIVAVAYMISVPLGLITTLAVIFHEIPQEIGDFGVLIYSGFSRNRALLFNFISASAAILGVVLTYIFSSVVENITVYLVPFAAGGFIYIAMTDLMAELKEEIDIRKATVQILIFLVGIFLMWLIKVIFGG